MLEWLVQGNATSGTIRNKKESRGLVSRGFGILLWSPFSSGVSCNGKFLTWIFPSELLETGKSLDETRLMLDSCLVYTQ